MRCLCAAVLLALPAIVGAQQSTTTPAANNTGELTPAWTVRDNVAAFAGQIQKLKPILDKVDPQYMVKEGAPPSYADVLKSAKAQLEYLLQTAEKLRAQPDAISLALETYFRLESLESLLGSTIEGVRKYQSPDLANILRAAITESANGREKLKQYMVELASAREVEFKVMDQEAQRCRQSLLKEQVPPPSRPRTTKKGTSK